MDSQSDEPGWGGKKWASLRPHTYAVVCPACGAARGYTEKWPLEYHDAREADARGNHCEDGGPTEHFHRQCIHCTYRWAEGLPNSEKPLTAEELREVRELLRLARIDNEPETPPW